MKGIIQNCDRAHCGAVSCPDGYCRKKASHCNPFVSFNMVTDIPGNYMSGSDWAAFWLMCEQEWAERFKFHAFYQDEDPDFATCPFCGLVGSCMCDELLQEELDPEGLGLEEDCGY